MIKHLFFRLKKYSDKDKRLIAAIKNIVGYRPFRLELYRLVTQHSSIAKSHHNGFKQSNERLEYLGDAILGAVVADYLFKKYPFKDEGFLTEIRSRLVNRESLSQLARKVGIKALLDVDLVQNKYSYKSLYGDMMEAFIGAVYLDKGYKSCRKFIINRLLQPHYDLDEIIKNNTNYKSILIEWSQKTGKEISFNIVDIIQEKRKKEFKAVIEIDGKTIAHGSGLNKKKAEQNAAFKACQLYKLD
ncbi:ribonuclease III [Marivirga sp. S37H4]|uniref:Ribonuclease 3 n=1 Tax=Marivirga aurantiaca TaxID=2802615 RepID=A0A935C707_9BACT|nr:ribonuclease III [Marivirga aurantiaca]MBK6264654.1 ribonuclease III [Marivirga aurantiaca]